MGTVREAPIYMDEAIELLGYKKSYIYKLIHFKKIPCYKPTGGRLYFKESELIDFINRGKKSANYEISAQADALLNRATKRSPKRGVK